MIDLRFQKPIDEGRVMRGQAIAKQEGQVKRLDTQTYHLFYSVSCLSNLYVLIPSLLHNNYIQRL